MIWHNIKDIKQTGENETSAACEINTESKWFSGHFPNEPILPAIAQIGIVFEVIKKFYKKPLKILNITRVRFKAMIRPCDLMTIIINKSDKEADSYSFRILVKDVMVCSGFISTAIIL